MNTYVKQQILHHHTVAQRGTFLPKHDLWSDMPPACHPEDIRTPWLSIKYNIGPPVRYETDLGSKYLLEPGHFLILNHNRAYRLLPDQEQAPQLFCLFFPPSWVADVTYSRAQSDGYLLDNPYASQTQTVEFVERLHPPDTWIVPLLKEMLSPIREGAVGDGLEEHLRSLFAHMLQLQHDLLCESNQLTATRVTTRAELYRRLYLAKDYMHASYGERLTIDELAGVAGLSSYHFLRSFKALFKQTPHAYLTQLRLDKAYSLLTETDIPITQIGLMVGFQSLPSFINRFRREIGISPRAYRQQR
ncbi:MAG: AraC family transcriptional regulator [Chloroflexota bacterium]